MLLRTARPHELDPPTLYALLRLRSSIFVLEQRCAYLDLDGRDLDPGTTHLWYDEAGVPQSYLRIVTERDGSFRVGRVCTVPAHRGRGYAGRLLAEALRIIGPPAPCRLEAQADLARFYAEYGFRPTGPRYLLDGIPHVPMEHDPMEHDPMKHDPIEHDPIEHDTER